MSSGDVSAAEALEMIQAGIAALSACDVDPAAGDAARLGEEATRILRAVGGLQMQAARRLARFDALGGPAGDGMPSLSTWLGRRCRLRPWEATRLAATARWLHLLDDAVAAFDEGSVEYGDVATIAEGVDRAAATMAPAWTPERIAEVAQPILLRTAPMVTPGQLRRVAARIALTLDGDNAERKRRQIERQAFLDVGQTIDALGVMRAEMGAADLAIVEKAIDVFAPGPDADRPRWANLPGHRRLRGLVTACEVALSVADRHGHREHGGAPVRVHVIATKATTDATVPVTQAPPGRTEYGTILTAGQVREMIQRQRASTVEILIGPDGRPTDDVTPDGQPLNHGRSRRLFTRAQREVFLALYLGCAAEGCDRPPAWADIDHKQAWADGGRTDLDNGQFLCRWHNNHKERCRQAERRDKGPPGTSPPGDTSPPEERRNDEGGGEAPPSAGPPSGSA